VRTKWNGYKSVARENWGGLTEAAVRKKKGVQARRKKSAAIKVCGQAGMLSLSENLSVREKSALLNTSTSWLVGLR